MVSSQLLYCWLHSYSKPEWRPTHFNQDGLRIIARLSARIFLPEPLCHDEDWLRISVDYTVDFFGAAFALRMIPAFLRPVVHWYLPQARKARQDVEIATRLIQPEIDARRKLKQEALREGREYEPPADALTWLEKAGEQRGERINLVWGQLNYSLGAIHTTSMTFIYVVYDLIDHPEYIQLLREEIDSVWKEGDELTKAVLYKLKLMDSFMKESQRLSPVTLGGHNISFFSENQNFITSKGVLLLITHISNSSHQ
jgi:cytochrome P450